MPYTKKSRIGPGYRVSTANLYLYQCSKIAKARAHSVEGPEYTSVQSSGHPGFLQGFSLFICVKSNYLFRKVMRWGCPLFVR